MHSVSAQSLDELLKRTSRSFYLTVRVLPGKIRPQIGLAYLLARASDTIADTDVVPKNERLASLLQFRRWITTGEGQPDLDAVASHQSSAAERDLLQNLNGLALTFRQFSHPDRERIRAVLETILSGQALDIERFAEGSSGQIASLQTDQELDDYTYRVAGCVGEFWTRMCRAHLFPKARLDDALLIKNGIRFGKGLQLVNVLRDLPADLRLGRCYVPEQRLRQAGLRPADLLDPVNQARFASLYAEYLDVAAAHLAAGWAYTNALPVRSVRVRLACAWPILIGVRTLTRLRQAQVLDPAQRVKISRKDVRAILIQSVIWYPWQSRWRRLASGNGAA